MIVDILPECYVDTNVVNTLLELPSKETTNHCHSCNKVGENMKNDRLSNQFAIGIIDKDKKPHSYMGEFEVIRELDHIELLKHPEKHHYIVRTAPAMERFLLDVAEETGVSLQDYELPTNLPELSKITKSAKAKDAANIKRLVRKLSVHPEMKSLQAILQYLHKNRYTSSIEDLMRL